MNRFQKSLAQLSKRMKQAGKIVALVYTQKSSGLSVTIEQKAWAGKQAFRIEDNGRSRLEWSDRDYMIPVASLIIEGELVIPERGDRITEIFDDPTGTKTYELMSPNDEQVFTYVGSQNMIYRCHTKEV